MTAMAEGEQARLLETFSVRPSLGMTLLELLLEAVPLPLGTSIGKPRSGFPLLGSVYLGVASTAVPLIEEPLNGVPPAAVP